MPSGPVTSSPVLHSRIVYVSLSGDSYMHNDVIREIDNWVDDGSGMLVNRRSHPSPARRSGRGPLVEKDHRTGTWQMLVPKPESTCNVFGINDLASGKGLGWGSRGQCR